ncbi:MAG: hypothetical protein V7L31_24730 [Nostoc sp.]|uniref:hypothetical protein n=1 Tax=Nostoc sp. TaxID=1180 RepID=UPI002FEF5C7D
MSGQTKTPELRKRNTFAKWVTKKTLTSRTHDDYNAADAVCWAPGRTIGNIAVSSEEAFGMFEGASGDEGKELQRSAMWDNMVQNTLY